MEARAGSATSSAQPDLEQAGACLGVDQEPVSSEAVTPGTVTGASDSHGELGEARSARSVTSYLRIEAARARCDLEVRYSRRCLLAEWSRSDEIWCSIGRRGAWRRTPRPSDARPLPWHEPWSGRLPQVARSPSRPRPTAPRGRVSSPRAGSTPRRLPRSHPRMDMIPRQSTVRQLGLLGPRPSASSHRREEGAPDNPLGRRDSCRIVATINLSFRRAAVRPDPGGSHRLNPCE